MYMKRLKSTSNAYGTPTKSNTHKPPMEEAGASKPNIKKVTQGIERARKGKSSQIDVNQISCEIASSQ
jgi:hypothetical protein